MKYKVQENEGKQVPKRGLRRGSYPSLRCFYNTKVLVYLGLWAPPNTNLLKPQKRKEDKEQRDYHEIHHDDTRTPPAAPPLAGVLPASCLIQLFVSRKRTSASNLGRKHDPFIRQRNKTKRFKAGLGLMATTNNNIVL